MAVESNLVERNIQSDAMEEDIHPEVEVFGVTYERYALQRLFARLSRRLQLHSVLEMPASGAKAMPSLYSLGFALAGCQVTLVDADEDALQIWRNLGLAGRLAVLDSEDMQRASRGGRRWDLCWNFSVLPTAEDAESLIRHLTMLSRKWIMFVNVNRFNVGFGLHRSVHRLWRIPWTHGHLSYLSPFYTAKLLRCNGLKEVQWGVVDCPPWPDSPGFRDLRLHRLGERQHRWICPYARYLQRSHFPGWLKIVYWGERLPFPALLKLPYAHLFYVLGRVDYETRP